PDGSISPEKIRHRLRLEQRQQDFMLLRNGDMVEGTLTKIREGKIEVESQKKTSGLRWTQISAITLSEELMERTILPANYVRIVLKSSNNDGGRFTLSEWTFTNGMIQGKTLFGSPFQAPLEQVAHLDIFSNGIVRLDKIQAKQMSHESFLGESYTTQFGCNSLWRDAQIARSYHDFCIGMHGQGKIEYKLDDNFRFFSTQVGLDDRDGLGGQAEIRVIADGKSLPLPRSGILTSPQMPLDLHLDVKNCKALILEVRWHKRGSIRSVVNWAKPILIK
ncbi:MAG: NPCBM/NEW2 domain-containing protein, partial [Gemmataceae bacterium]